VWTLSSPILGYLVRHSSELIKMTQTFVGMSEALVTIEIDFPPSLRPFSTPLPSVWWKLLQPLTCWPMSRIKLVRSRPTDLPFCIFCPSVTVALGTDASGVISEWFIYLFILILLLLFVIIVLIAVILSFSFFSSLHQRSVQFILYHATLSFHLVCSFVNM
jgi:hypothetical protein